MEALNETAESPKGPPERGVGTGLAWRFYTCFRHTREYRVLLLRYGCDTVTLRLEADNKGGNNGGQATLCLESAAFGRLPYAATEDDRPTAFDGEKPDCRRTTLGQGRERL